MVRTGPHKYKFKGFNLEKNIQVLAAEENQIYQRIN